MAPSRPSRRQLKDLEARDEGPTQTILEEAPVGFHGIQQDDLMKEWSSIRMVYLLMSVVLLLSAAYQSWGGVLFVVVMLQVAVWTRFCPSLWLFNRAGYKETEI